MRSRPIFIVAGLGMALAVASAILFAREPKAQPPVFNPAANPYANGIYANGIVESEQAEGENITLYPEVSGPVTAVLAAEGSAVRKGDLLLTIDDSVQRATAEQQRSQAAAADALLRELKAQPRKEALDVAAAQVDSAKAALKSVGDSLAKLELSYELAPASVSLDALDTARNAVRMAQANLGVAQRQYELTRAGAWRYDIENQAAQTAALGKAASASEALLAKYAIRAPADGTVLAVQAGVGSYVSPQGAYNSYTEGYGPLIVMGSSGGQLAVRAFIDEILVHRLPAAKAMQATLFVRGTDIRIPLRFVRVQPYVSPKIQLSDQREERVDVRVLPVIFRFETPKGVNLYPGQLVDVYIGEN